MELLFVHLHKVREFREHRMTEQNIAITTLLRPERRRSLQNQIVELMN